MRIFTVDSFTDEPFSGNPASVCLLDGPATDEWMQSVAAEMRHSETAFLLGDSLRWFTPAVEVDLCGHATLATAHVLYSEGLASGPLAFSTRSGVLEVTQGPDDTLLMDFPAHVPVEVPVPDLLVKALGVPVLWAGMSKFDLLAEVDSAETIRNLSPDLDGVASFDVRAVLVTALADSEDADYVSRFFAPRVGVPEDPVTGSAHCVLGPYWSAKLGRDSLVGAQLSPRGGGMRTTVRGDRVELAGRAVTVWSGTLHV
jgi:PhzF family phenazine biosynthesis protein